MQALKPVLDEMEIAHCVSRFSAIANTLGEYTSSNPGGADVVAGRSRSEVEDGRELSAEVLG
jgi:hypothetical protein